MAKKGFFSWFRKDKSKDEAKTADVEIVAEDKVQDENVKFEQQASVDVQGLEEQAHLQVKQEDEAKKQEVNAQEAKIQEEQAQAGKIRQEQQVLAEAQAAEAQEQARLQALKEEQEAQARQEQQALAEAQEQARLQALKEEQEAQARQEQQALAEAQAAETQEQARLQVLKEEQEAQARQEQQALAEAQEQARLQALKEEQETQARQEQQALADAQAAKIAEESKALVEEEIELQPEPQAKPTKEGFFARLKRGLKRTSENIGSGFVGLFRGKKIDDDLFEELEEQLLMADVGVETTTRLINNLTEQASRKQLKDGEALYDLLREEMQKTLEPVSVPLVPENKDGPFVILMVGVNGVGKTTTIGKLAKQYQEQGKSVMLAAGDTFRAAAVEQLQVWGQRNNIPVVAQHTGADSASVLFDALQSAKARNVDVLIADTAGRLQNKTHLMDELKKVVRVMKKQDENAPHEVMLTLDACTGQNAISQAQLFKEAVGVTGITISKLDGTAKGGVIFAIADKFGIPIRHIGVGEQIDDLRTFNAKDFIDALFSQENADNLDQ